MSLAAPASDSLPAKLRGFGPTGLFAAALLVFADGILPPVGAILVLAWARLSLTPWCDIGFVLPERWLRTAAIGIPFGIALKFLMKAIVMPLFGADPINHAFHYLAGNRAALPGAIYMMIVVAGFGEETLFRGYAFERLRKLIGRGRAATIAIVLTTSALFGAAHYSLQGVAGVEQATVVGLILGTIYAATGRIWLPMFIHAAFDLAALAMIFWNLETRVAHLVFR